MMNLSLIIAALMKQSRTQKRPSVLPAMSNKELDQFLGKINRDQIIARVNQRRITQAKLFTPGFIASNKMSVGV